LVNSSSIAGFTFDVATLSAYDAVFLALPPVVDQRRLVGGPAIEALGDHPDFDSDHVEPAGVFGPEVKLSEGERGERGEGEHEGREWTDVA
jgi:hypothetical protein